MKAVILVSGGLDSATVMAIAQEEGYEIYPLSFDYGQRHNLELQAVQKLVERYKLTDRHKVLKLDFSGTNLSALTSDIEVPKNRDIDETIPITYVPARNTIFLSYALGYAEVIGARSIFIGAHSIDYSCYPDCRPEYIDAFEKLANLATKAGVAGDYFAIKAPLLYMNKMQIIKTGLSLEVDYSITSSCYDPIDGSACGECDSCQIRLRAFKSLGLRDPISYCK